MVTVPLQGLLASPKTGQARAVVVLADGAGEVPAGCILKVPEQVGGLVLQTTPGPNTGMANVKSR